MSSSVLVDWHFDVHRLGHFGRKHAFAAADSALGQDERASWQFFHGAAKPALSLYSAQSLRHERETDRAVRRRMQGNGNVTVPQGTQGTLS